jgi:hypothetical protein
MPPIYSEFSPSKKIPYDRETDDEKLIRRLEIELVSKNSEL